MATLNDLMNCIELLNDDFNLFNSQSNPATIEQIEEYEKNHGLTFNDDVKEFLQTYGIIILEVKEEVWRRPKLYDVLPTWQFGYGMFVFGLSSNSNIPSWMTYEEKYLETMTNGSIELGQMIYKRTGNSYRAYINNNTVTIEYDHSGEDEDREVFEGNFYDFLINEIDKLDADYIEYKSKYPKK